MKRRIFRPAILVVLMVVLAGCEGVFGPKTSGEFQLSSQRFGTEYYYLFGYSYEQAEFYRFEYQGEPIPDIINEGYRLIKDGEVTELPGFNAPTKENGFALVGQFTSLEEGRSYYEDYEQVEAGLQFEIVSDTVELYQVWIQQTSLGNYVKLFVKNIEILEGETGNIYSEVTLEYTYQPNGSTDFPN